MGDIDGMARVPWNRRAKLRQLWEDLEDLRKRLGQAQPSEGQELNEEWLRWYVNVPRTHLAAALAFEADSGRTSEFAAEDAGLVPQVECPDCEKVFATVRAMTSHRKWKHSWVEPWRFAVQEPKCPACGKEFGCEEVARTHLQRRTCSQSKEEWFVQFVEAQARAHMEGQGVEQAGERGEEAITLHMALGLEQTEEVAN